MVPTGNFGNILAAYYAKMMGVPLGKLICASNINKVLTDFIRTGVYNRNRQFYPTASPSMDILISSNLERLLYLLTGEDDAQIREWFTALAEQGTYEVTDAVKAKLTEQFYGASVTMPKPRQRLQNCTRSTAIPAIPTPQLLSRYMRTTARKPAIPPRL